MTELKKEHLSEKKEEQEKENIIDHMDLQEEKNKNSSVSTSPKIKNEDDIEEEEEGEGEEEIEEIDITTKIDFDRSILEDNKSFCCPITMELLVNPVFCDGFTFEEKSIIRWFQSGRSKNPQTGEKISVKQQVYFKNREKKSDVNSYRESISKQCNDILETFIGMKDLKKKNVVLSESSIDLIIKIIDRSQEIQPNNSKSMKNSLLCYKKLQKILSNQINEEKNLEEKREDSFRRYYNMLIQTHEFETALNLLKNEENFEKSWLLVELYLQIQEFQKNVHPDRRLRLILVRLFMENITQEERARFWMFQMKKEEHDFESLDLYRRIPLRIVPIEDYGVFTIFHTYHLDLLCSKHCEANQFQECYDVLFSSEIPEGKSALFDETDFVLFSDHRLIPLYEKYLKIFYEKAKRIDLSVKVCMRLSVFFRRKNQIKERVKILKTACDMIDDQKQQQKKKQEFEEEDYSTLLKMYFEAQHDLLKLEMEKKVEDEVMRLRREIRRLGISVQIHDVFPKKNPKVYNQDDIHEIKGKGLRELKLEHLMYPKKKEKN